MANEKEKAELSDNPQKKLQDKLVAHEEGWRVFISNRSHFESTVMWDSFIPLTEKLVTHRKLASALYCLTVGHEKKFAKKEDLQQLKKDLMALSETVLNKPKIEFRSHGHSESYSESYSESHSEGYTAGVVGHTVGRYTIHTPNPSTVVGFEEVKRASFWNKVKTIKTPEDAYIAKHPFLNSFGVGGALKDFTENWKLKLGLTGFLTFLIPADFVVPLFSVFVFANALDFLLRNFFKAVRKHFSSQTMISDLMTFLSRFIVVVAANLLYLSGQAIAQIDSPLSSAWPVVTKFILPATVLWGIFASLLSTLQLAGMYVKLPEFLKPKKLMRYLKVASRAIREDSKEGDARRKKED